MTDKTTIPGGAGPTATGNDSVEVTMAIPLPPLPSAVAPPPMLHPDAGNWIVSAPDPEVGDPAYKDDPVMAALAPPAPAPPAPIEGAEVVFAPGQDNVEAAMHEMAESMDLTVSTKISDDDGPADKQILIRATEHDRERWKRAAEVEKVSLSALIRETMNGRVTAILDCTHPPQFRKEYPWASFCTKCDMRLSG